MTTAASQPTASPLDDALRRLGYDAFRPGQREAIETLLEVRRLLLVAPTGGGKSLTYQLPSLFLPGTTVVVSPLIALMADQVRALQARGVEATYLASTLDADEGRRRFAAIAQGRVRIAYVAPERLAMPGFRRMLSELSCPLLAIDEAHCISEWGHDFRPEYLQIGALISDLKPARVLACTATATPIVRDEILARLGLPPDTPQHVHGFARPNLALRAVEVGSGKEADRLVDDALLETLGFPGEVGRGAAIVYAPTRRRADEEAQRLRARGGGGRVGVYHAGLMPEARSKTQEAFSSGELEIVVATNAFGMGIDRADVRLVVHLAPPSSIEAYYQEVGRAGRDGKDAVGLLLVAAQDMPLRRRLIERGSGEGFAPPPKEVVEHKWQLFLELMRFVEGGSCRHDAILRYFGDEREALQGCGRCDVCLSLEREPDVDSEERALIVRKALSGVARVHGRFGLVMAAKLLVGASDERLSRTGLDLVRTFGTLSDWPEERVVRLLRRCVSAGFVSFEGDERPVVVLTDDGLRAMKGQRPAQLVLPPVLVPRKRSKRGSRSAFALPAAKAAGSGEPTVVHEIDETLFAALRAHRLERARAEGIPPYMVASDRTLRELCLARPRTRDALMGVYGIGEAKAERYGEGLLAVVAAHS